MGRRRLAVTKRPRYGPVRFGKKEHIRLAEKALGKRLPEGAEVHHVNGIKTDNGPWNLVVCQDHAYHFLLETRTRALKECGNANWKKCRKCLRWDDPANMQTKDVTPTFTKYWHYRFKGECVNRGERAEIRRQAPRPAPLYRGGKVAMHHARFIGPERAAEIERQRLEAFRAWLESDAPTIRSGDADVCACGERGAKRHEKRYCCVGCGRQKRAGFVRRNPGAAITVDTWGRRIA